MIRKRFQICRFILPWICAVIGVARCSGTLRAAEPLPSLAAGTWNDWWLNTNYAEHGKSVDEIFYFIFWLTTAILVLVQVVLVWIMIKYRHRPGAKKAVYLHGNTRVEMVWTLIPAVILIVVALWTKRAWDAYRYSPIAEDPHRLKVLVIGEQFKWNVIYPGPKGTIGRFLIYPKTTDLVWPTVPANKAGGFSFPNVPGPAYLPEAQAREVLNRYTADINPLGRDYSDLETDPLLSDARQRLNDLRRRSESSSNLDASESIEFENLKQLEALNDYPNTLRALVIPKGRPVEIQITSRDVIHDFFLPNFRTRLDTVPGMRGKLYLTATQSGKDVGGGVKEYTPDQLQELVNKLGANDQITVVINKVNPGEAGLYKVKPRPRHWEDVWGYARKSDEITVREGFPVKKPDEIIVRDGFPVTQQTINELCAAGIKKVTAKVPFYWDIVCEELCGNGHATMQGKLAVVEEGELQSDYKNFYPEKPRSASSVQP